MGDRLVKRLHKLSSLQDGWMDGEGVAPSGIAIEMAFPLAVAFKDDGPSLFPTLTGGVLFEGAGFDLEISACGISQYEALTKEQG